MISEFLAILGKHHHARPTLFQVEILTIPELTRQAEGISEFQKDLKFYCSAVEMPGTQILTQENRIYDLPEKYAYLKAHDEMTLTVRVDKDYLSKKFFDAWVQAIYNKPTGNPFYKKSYISEIQISTMREDGTCPYAMKLIDCFPTSIGNLSYSWESTGSVQQFSVTMAFTREEIVARSSLFTPKGTNGTGATTNTGNTLTQSENTDLDFNVQNVDSVSTYKDNVFSTLKTAYTEGLTRKTTMQSSLPDISIIRKSMNLF